MKFLIAFVALLVCVSAQDGRTKCTFFSDTLKLSCKGPTGSAECSAIASLSQGFKIIGLGFDPMSTDPTAFRLFPLKLDNTKWLATSMTIGPQAQEGLKIRDSSCFERLANMFRASSSTKMVPVEKLGATDKVGLFGEIFVFDRSFSRSAF